MRALYDFPPLPIPVLEPDVWSGIPVLTDKELFKRCGVKIAFTGRAGGVSGGGSRDDEGAGDAGDAGVSENAFSSLNLSDNVGDDPRAVEQNRHALAKAVGAQPENLIVPKQVHGNNLVCVEVPDVMPDPSKVACAQVASSNTPALPALDNVAPSTLSKALRSACDAAQAGADGIIVGVPNVAALLCFADCVPVIIVSPSGNFAVVHAGWRGVMNGIVPKAIDELRKMNARAGYDTSFRHMHAYIGPHIGACCFEVGDDVREQFRKRFGDECIKGKNVDLSCALVQDMADAGLFESNITDANICTVCNSRQFFSYRDSGGKCGRHGAIAFSTPESKTLMDSRDY